MPEMIIFREAGDVHRLQAVSIVRICNYLVDNARSVQQVYQMCVYVYVCRYMHTRMYMFLCVCVCRYICVFVGACWCVCVSVCLSVCLFANVYVGMCVCVCVYVCVYVCVDTAIRCLVPVAFQNHIADDLNHVVIWLYNIVSQTYTTFFFSPLYLSASVFLYIFVHPNPLALTYTPAHTQAHTFPSIPPSLYL